MNPATPTPRTDEIENRITLEVGIEPAALVVWADFARQLERENAELRGKLERLADGWARDYWDESADKFKCAAELRAILQESACNSATIPQPDNQQAQ